MKTWNKTCSVDQASKLPRIGFGLHSIEWASLKLFSSYSRIENLCTRLIEPLIRSIERLQNFILNPKITQKKISPCPILFPQPSIHNFQTQSKKPFHTVKTLPCMESNTTPFPNFTKTLNKQNTIILQQLSKALIAHNPTTQPKHY
jgi:hypothetical protein